VHCPHCGYNLTGLTEDRCPECGNEFDRTELEEQDRRIPYVSRRNFWRMVIYPPALIGACTACRLHIPIFKGGSELLRQHLAAIQLPAFLALVGLNIFLVMVFALRRSSRHGYASRPGRLVAIAVAYFVGLLFIQVCVFVLVTYVFFQGLNVVD